MCAPGTTAPDESETEIERLAVLESANTEDEGKVHNIASIALTTDRRKGTSFLGILLLGASDSRLSMNSVLLDASYYSSALEALDSDDQPSLLALHFG
jgi:hypothetical protein